MRYGEEVTGRDEEEDKDPREGVCVRGEGVLLGIRRWSERKGTERWRRS